MPIKNEVKFSSPKLCPSSLKVKMESKQWILYSIWHSDVSPLLHSSSSNMARLKSTKEKFSANVQKCFSRLHETEFLFERLKENFLVVRVNPVDNLEKDSTDPLDLEVTELRFTDQKLLRQTKNSCLRLTVYGGLGEIFRAIISTNDLLVICGGDISIEFGDWENRSVSLNCGESLVPLQIIRFPRLQSYESRFQLVEKIKPLQKDLYTFKYWAHNPDTISSVDVSRCRPFTLKENRNSPDYQSWYRDKYYLYVAMPIEKSMDPYGIYFHLISPDTRRMPRIPESESESSETSEEEAEVPEIPTVEKMKEMIVFHTYRLSSSDSENSTEENSDNPPEISNYVFVFCWMVFFSLVCCCCCFLKFLIMYNTNCGDNNSLIRVQEGDGDNQAVATWFDSSSLYLDGAVSLLNWVWNLFVRTFETICESILWVTSCDNTVRDDTATQPFMNSSENLQDEVLINYEYL